LLDALTVAGHVHSPAALSEEVPFRRKFSSILDTPRQTEIDFDLLLEALHALQPPDSQRLGRDEVYALDTTPNERPEAQALEDRGSLLNSSSHCFHPIEYIFKRQYHSFLPIIFGGDAGG
jgi:hypothetical protein